MNAEDALFGLLTEIDSIEKLDEAGFRSEYIPTEELEPVYDFAIRYWEDNGRVSAPTAVVFKETKIPGGGTTYAQLLSEYLIDIDHVPEESVEWVIDQLKGGHFRSILTDWTTSFAEDFTIADASDLEGEVNDHIDRLIALRDRHTHGLGSEDMRVWTAAELAGEDTTFDWLIKGLLSHPTYGMIAGEQKSLKSYIAGSLMVGLASGTPIFGEFTVPEARPVLTYVGEGGRPLWTRRMNQICTAMGLSFSDLPIHAVFDIAPADSPRFQTSLRRNLERYEPGLVTIDPWYTYHGTDANAANLFDEGALLTKLSDPCVNANASLMVVNHYNKTGSGTGLKRITMAGGAQWSDSWILVRHQETPTDEDVDQGTFHLVMEVGSRQWGGSTWGVDFDIGHFDPELGTHQGEMTWTVTRGNGQQSANQRRQDLSLAAKQREIRDVLTDHPFERTKTQIKTIVGGGRQAFEEAWEGLISDAVICEIEVVRGEGGKAQPRGCWGHVQTQAVEADE